MFIVESCSLIEANTPRRLWSAVVRKVPDKARRVRPGLTLLCSFAGALFHATGTVQAHPVSQGALEVAIFRDHIDVRATVTMEEVLVAAAYDGQHDLSQLERVRGHGEYLLLHLRVIANGKRLEGRVAGVPERTSGRPSYELEYRPTEGGLPGRITLQQDVLREFDFAPGNPWEASYLVRVSHEGGSPLAGFLLTSRDPLILETRMHETGSPMVDQLRTGMAFLRHGITHILTGYDHLLFVGALVLAVAGLWDLVKVISAFTLAHTVTLALATLDVFRVSSLIVEPMIAASIVFVAAQNVFWPRQSRGWIRLLVAFLFGLFHGLGFAGGLLDVMSAMRAEGAAVAIAAFSVGVEIGHQLVVLPAFFVLGLVRRYSPRAPGQDRVVQRYGSVAISLAGMIYLVSALR
jgi:HupE / UreJ protein